MRPKHLAAFYFPIHAKRRSFFPSWLIPYMDQNALSQSDCRIFKSTFFPEEIDETALFFANSQKLQHDQKIFIGHGQKRVWPILSWNLKLTVSEE